MKKFLDFLKKIKPDSAYLVLFVFVMLLFSRFVISMLGDTANKELAVILLQLLTFGFPAAIAYRLKTLDIFQKEAKINQKYHLKIRLTPPRPIHTVIMLSAILALISGGLLFSIGLSGKSSLEGSFSLYDTFISKYNGTTLGAVWLMLAYGALPAFCEEMIFRGILCNEYEEKYGAVCAIFMNTLWFGFLHFNLSKLTVYLFAGLVLSALLYATRSLFCVMAVHFAYNLFGIFGQQS